MTITSGWGSVDLVDGDPVRVDGHAVADHQHRHERVVRVASAFILAEMGRIALLFGCCQHFRRAAVVSGDRLIPQHNPETPPIGQFARQLVDDTRFRTHVMLAAA